MSDNVCTGSIRKSVQMSTAGSMPTKRNDENTEGKSSTETSINSTRDVLLPDEANISDFLVCKIVLVFPYYTAKDPFFLNMAEVPLRGNIFISF